MTEKNPYASPVSAVPVRDTVQDELDLQDWKKARAIIKDAGSFWLGIILCFICCAVGVVLSLHYFLRYQQWRSLASKYPVLVSNDGAASSFKAKFKSAQWKLLTGMVVSGMTFVLFVGYLLVGYFISPQ